MTRLLSLFVLGYLVVGPSGVPFPASANRPFYQTAAPCTSVAGMINGTCVPVNVPASLIVPDDTY